MNKFCSINKSTKSDNKNRRKVKGLKRNAGCIIAAIIIPIFSCNASALEVIPSGECVGVKLYTDGPVVIDTTPLVTKDGTTVDIASGCGIEKGDIIRKINGEKVTSNQMLTERITENPNDITLTIARNNKEREITLSPADTADGPKLGLWLRDSTAGLGTITCYTDDGFAALGHGICDIDTGNIMPIGRGIIQGCTVTAVSRGEKGSPGAMTGEIEGEEIGIITENTERGLFGTLTSVHQGQPVEVAKKSEVRCGAAQILADVDGRGVRRYNIEIKHIAPPIIGTKDMVIRVTDDILIKKTGGIVQGMSGAPILQNGKLVGAVTHVFVKDSLSGYAILAEHMLKDGL